MKISLREELSHPHADELGQLYELWAEAFGDKVEYAKEFFGLCDIENNVIVVRYDGEIVSMLTELPVRQKGIGDAAYICGAATKRDFRGRGYMAALLNDSAARWDRSFLIPSDAGLAEMYKRYGYTGASYSVYPEKRSTISVGKHTDADSLYNVYLKTRRYGDMIKPRRMFMLSLDGLTEALYITENGYRIEKDGVVYDEFPKKVRGAEKALFRGEFKVIPSVDLFFEV